MSASASIKCADAETLADTQFLDASGSGAFHIEINIVHFEMSQSWFSPLKSALCPSFEGRQQRTFHLERRRTYAKIDEAAIIRSLGLIVI